MPLSTEERKARDNELAAKRAKKEEEAKAILKQAEADRKAREERTTYSNVVQAVEGGIQVANNASKYADLKSVKLQFRCPNFADSKVIVFTAFTPDSTLSECASALRVELIKGICQSSGVEEAVAAERVPTEDAFVFVETVPPRKRWTSPADMQVTLRNAGLCPNASLLADFRPIELPSPVPEVNQENPLGSHTSEGSTSAEIEPDDEDEAADEDDGADNGVDDDEGSQSSGDDSDSGKGGFGKGFGKGFQKGKGFGKGFDDDDDDEMDYRKGHQFPEQGGHVLGKDDGTKVLGGGLALVAKSDSNVSEAEKQRAQKLAALERRMNASSSSVSEPLATRAKGPMGGDGVNREERDKERRDILQRIEEDRLEKELRKAPKPVSSVVKTGEDDEKDKIHLQVRCSTTRKVHMPIGLKRDSLLRDVCDSAAKALEVEAPMLSLGYPPWTEFGDEQLGKTLSELSLCYSATLLISTRSPIAPRECPLGPLGHPMIKFELQEDGWCDKCKSEIAPGVFAWECKHAGIVMCQDCCSKQSP